MSNRVRRLLFSAEPFPDESFIGYLCRLRDLNDYDTLSWIVQLAEIKGYARSGLSFTFNSSLDLSPLASLTGIDVSEIAPLLYRPVKAIKRGVGDYFIFNNPAPKYIIRIRRPKICPYCLRESGYLRKIWELAPVTACAIHKCLLLDKCPNCKRHITWIRDSISTCSCKFNWCKLRPPQIKASELAITHRIHQLCNLTFDDAFNSSNLHITPLLSLDLKHLISALFFVAGQFAGIVDTTGKYLTPSRRNSELHSLITKAISVFEEWPKNYYEFLNWCRNERSKEKHERGLSKDFGDYKYALYRQLSSQQLDFMRSEFETYLITRWDGGNISMIPRLQGASLQKKKYASMVEASTRLGMASIGIDSLIATGRLKAVIRNLKHSRLILIEEAGLKELEQKLKHTLYLKNVEKLLGLTYKRILDLVDARLLNPVRGPMVDNYSEWKFSEKEVSTLLKNIKKQIVKQRFRKEVDKVSFSIALRQLNRVDVGMAQFLMDILKGDIRPFDQDTKPGLSSFLFSREHISAYVRDQRRVRRGEVFCAKEAARFLGVAAQTIYFLVKKGFLHSEKRVDERYTDVLVTRNNLNLFNSTYVLPSKIAPGLNTVSGYLTKLLISKGIRPVCGPMIDGSPRYVFKKSDLKSINMTDLISSARAERASQIKEAGLLSEIQAAKTLGVSMEALRGLVGSGILQPHRRLPQNKFNDNGYYFSDYAIKAYKNRAIDFTGFVSAKVAAKMLNSKPSNFRAKYVDTGRLTAVLTKGKRRNQYFQRNAIEAVIKLESGLIRAAEAAEILDVTITLVHRMTLLGELTPITGPRIDGFGYNLYLRSDVEKLQRERAAFKAACIKEGKTGRYGRLSGRGRAHLVKR